MSALFPRLTLRLRHWLHRDDSGTAAVEFVVMFPLIVLIFSISFEAGVLAARQSMLERGTNIAVRDLRIGTNSPPTHAELKERVCQAATIIPDCLNAVHIELAPVSMETWDLDRGPAMCIDREQDIAPATAFSPGGSNELMLVRVCAVFQPIYPAASLAMNLTHVTDSDYALVATSAFVNEP